MLIDLSVKIYVNVLHEDFLRALAIILIDLSCKRNTRKKLVLDVESHTTIPCLREVLDHLSSYHEEEILIPGDSTKQSSLNDSLE